MTTTSIDKFDIVPAVPADAQSLMPLMAAFNEAEGIPWRPGPMGAALHGLLGDPALGVVLLARVRASGATAGYSLATFGYDLEFAGPDAFITELFVAPPLRCRGLGRALLDATVERLGERGVHAVHLMVRPENGHARRLYESRGFNAAPRIMMTKRLGPEAK
jgi:diamine N-acetyltransferase